MNIVVNSGHRDNRRVKTPTGGPTQRRHERRKQDTKDVRNRLRKYGFVFRGLSFHENNSGGVADT